MSELKSDFGLIDDPEFRRHAARDMFKATMRDKSYGREPLNQAWAFFKAGWDEGWNACDSAMIALGHKIP
jgi:hypothetical protein